MRVRANTASGGGGGTNSITFNLCPNVANGRVWTNGLVLSTSDISHFKSTGAASAYANVGYLDALPTGETTAPSLINPVSLASADFDVDTTHPYLCACGTIANFSAPVYEITLTF